MERRSKLLASYHNEFKNGVENGYWLIDSHGIK
jgi:hypothetical protein